MNQKVKLFESRSADGLENQINEFAKTHIIQQVSYHRREPVINPSSVMAANQSLHCCMVLYTDALAPSDYETSLPEADESDNGLMGLDT